MNATLLSVVAGALFHAGVAIFWMGKMSERVAGVVARVAKSETRLEDHETRISRLEGRGEERDAD